MKTRWISVKTCIPHPVAPGDFAYLVTDGMRVWIERCHPSWWNYRPRDSEFLGPFVTHWMPVPALPAKRKKHV